jgi:hypothetical protein
LVDGNGEVAGRSGAGKHGVERGVDQEGGELTRMTTKWKGRTDGVFEAKTGEVAHGDGLGDDGRRTTRGRGGRRRC